MKTFAIHTLGCKVNSFESQSMIDEFKLRGYQEVGFQDVADIYLIHTCAVTNTAALKSRQKIRQAIKANPMAMICVVGCYVQTNAADLLKIEGVDVLIGTSGKNEVVAIVEKAMKKKESAPILRIGDIRKSALFEATTVNRFDHQVRAYLKVQDGCNQFCSYCIIPYARGIERSVAPRDAIRNAKELVEKGHQEIVLAGIHTGRYGVDHQTTLFSLLQQIIAEVPKLKRLRLSSIEANEISSEMIVFLSKEKAMASHLHIPLQAGADHTLLAMNRTYNTGEFLSKLEEIRNYNPLISISSDVIVGFPQESREDFERTIAFIKQCNFSFIHVFPYSKRENTVAAAMNGHVDQIEKKYRVQVVSELSRQLRREYHALFLKKEVQVLVEYSAASIHHGHSSEYIKVVIEKETRNLKGQLVSVIIDSFDEDTCYGHLA